MPKSQGGGFDKLRKTIEELSKHQAKTGWPENPTYEDKYKTKFADVAEYNEFGTTKIPARPFMRTAIAQNEQKWKQVFAEGVRKCVNGGDPPTLALLDAASTAAGDIALVLRDFTTPPNAPSTIERKGKDDPLMESGLLFQNITGIVEPKE